MKLKINVKRINKKLDLPMVTAKGDWIDLRASETHRFNAPQSGVLKTVIKDEETIKVRDVKFDTFLMPLGIAVKLPKGFEAVVVARSSLPFGYGLFVGNAEGVIDNKYCGNKDEWKVPLVALRPTTISANERICQFRIQLSQKATLWQKLKWLFSNGVEIVEVEELLEENRGGFGSTGKV